MSLVTIAEVRALIQTDATDPELQLVINRQEAEVIRWYGAHYVDASTTIVETHEGGRPSLFLNRPILSVSTVKVQALGGTQSTLASTNYYVRANQGRLDRLSAGSCWEDLVEVTYVPQDDTQRRKDGIVELVRLAVERTAMKSENVAGEYSYQAPEWERERARILRRLGFPGV